MRTSIGPERRTRATDRGQRRRTAVSLACAIAAFAAALVVPHIAEVSSAAADQDPAQCPNSLALTNGGFEQPVVPAGAGNLFVTDSQVPGWNTTAADRVVEIWSSGFLGIAADSGQQFIELNATQASTMFQDVPTTPGQTLAWSLAHRGRGGVDSMRVIIGSPTGPLAQSGPVISDGNTAWGLHTGTYTVPAGQTTTRFAFEAVSAASGNITIGNFLDSISFGTGPCIIADKQVQNLSGGSPAEVGDTLRYSLTATNNGGTPALLTAAIDDLPDGVELVPGSMSITAGPGAGSVTDTLDADRGAYSAEDRFVAFLLGDGVEGGAGGTLQPGVTTTATFDVRITAATGGAVSNTAIVEFTDPVTQTARESTTQTTITEVVPAPIPPRGVSDAATGAYNTPVTVDPTRNDEKGDPGAEFDPSTVRLIDPVSGSPVTSVTIPGEGAYSVDATTGAVTFTPDPAFAGEATPLAYTAETTLGDSVTADITVTIASPEPPAAENDSGDAPYNQSVTVSPLANDDAGPSGTSFDGTTLRLLEPDTGAPVTTLAVPGEGSWTVDVASGEVTFTPEDGFSGRATDVRYTADTNVGDSVTATISAAIAKGPIASADSSTVLQGRTATVDVLDNDTAGEAAAMDYDSVELLDELGTEVESLEAPGQGVWTVGPLGTVVFTPEPGFVGTVTASYRAADTDGNPVVGSVSVTVTAATPVLEDDTASTGSGARVTIDPLENDAPTTGALDRSSLRLVDPAAGALVTRLALPDQGVYVVDSATGLINFTADSAFRGESRVQYSVADASGNRSTANIRVSVTEAGSPGAAGPSTRSSDGRPLAATGGSVEWQSAGVGILLLLAGAAAFALHRRRRQR